MLTGDLRLHSFAQVVGLGGVGSHCANMLVRSGVGRVRLIDFDQVTLSSLNRHAVCNMSDVGISKAEAMRRKLKEIVPWCQVEAITEMFRIEEADRLLEGAPSMVVDCIDDVATKAELIAFCMKNKLPIITSMGAGGKSDPTKLRISPLSDCINGTLSRTSTHHHFVRLPLTPAPYSGNRSSGSEDPVEAEEARRGPRGRDERVPRGEARVRAAAAGRGAAPGTSGECLMCECFVWKDVQTIMIAKI